MKNKPKPTPKVRNTIPAWECPKCGRTHPITVQTCECRGALTQPYPPSRDNCPWWEVTKIWCRNRR